jgi:hypothetical protein
MTTMEEDLGNPYITEEDKELIRQVLKLQGDAAAGAIVENILSNPVMKNFMAWIDKEVENARDQVFNAKSEESTQDLRIKGRTLKEVKNWFETQIQYGKLAQMKLDQDDKEMKRLNQEFGINTEDITPSQG